MTTTTVEDAGLELTVPPGWERVETPGIPLAIAGTARQGAADGTTFRPSVTAIVAPASPNADIRTLGTEAIAAAMTTVEGAHVVAYDLWNAPGTHVGRRLEFTCTAGAVALRVVQWFVLADGVVSTLTATCPVAELARLAPVLDAVAATVRLPNGAR